MTRCIVLVLCLLLPTAALAAEMEATGLGGGGWLQSGAFHPTNPEIILVGADATGGIYRTEDFGNSWRPWNTGLPNHDEAMTMYAEDLIGVLEQGQPVFYAATHGGIFRRADTGLEWSAETPPAAYCYNRYDANDDLTPALPIPFACLAWDGGNYLYATAGRVRWDSSYETSYYPGLATGIHDSYIGEASDSLETEVQYPLWRKDIEADGAWVPWAYEGSPEMGTPRDISVATIDGVTFVALCTTKGIFVHNGATGEWQDYTSDRLQMPDGTHPDGLLYGTSLTSWSVHLTQRGTLYVAMERISADPDRPSGVYMIPNITKTKLPALGHTWYWVDNGAVLDPWLKSLQQIGLENNGLLYLSVVDGVDRKPDTLYLGARRGNHGLLKGSQPPFRTKAPFTCSWQAKVWSEDSSESSFHEYFYTDHNGVPHTLDVAWLTPWGPQVLFHPAVASSDPERLLVQFNARLHVTATGGDSWQQSFDMGTPGAWVSRGYNELCVKGMDFMSDGRVVLGNADCGTFRATDSSQSAFEWLMPPLPAWSNPPTPTDNISWTMSSEAVHVRPNYLGGGKDAVFVNHGGTVLSNQPSKLFKYTDDPPTWENVTATLNSLETYLFSDFTFSNDETIFLIYRQFNQKVGTDGAYVIDCGILKGTLIAGGYHWEEHNDGLLAYDSSFNMLGGELMYHQPSGTVYLAARYFKLTTPIDTVAVRGALYTVDADTGSVWTKIFGGLKTDGSRTDFMDFQCLAQSADGGIVYAGTRGRSMSGYGSVLKFIGPGGVGAPTGTAADSCEVLANSDADPNTFGFVPPFWTDALDYSHDSFSLYPGRYLTDVRSLAVDPTNPEVLYVGMSCEGFAAKEGLWTYNVDGPGVWTHKSPGHRFTGMGVSKLRLNPVHTPLQLIFGTNGQGSYLWDIPDTVVIPPDPIDPPEISLGPTLRQIGGPADQVTVKFSVNRPGSVTLAVYDVLGRLTYSLWTTPLSVGEHEVTWSGRNIHGARAASGVYFLRVTGDDQRSVGRKVVLLR